MIKKKKKIKPKVYETSGMRLSQYKKIVLRSVFIVAFGLLLVFKSSDLSNLMGNSITHYKCPNDTYTLKGDKCVMTITHEAYSLGDINKDDKIDSTDYQILKQSYQRISSLDSYKQILADVNQDNVVNEKDLTLLYEYINQLNNTSSIGKYVCQKGYYLQKGVCTKEVAISASK